MAENNNGSLQAEEFIDSDIVADESFKKAFEELTREMEEHIAEHEKTLAELEAVKKERDEALRQRDKAHEAILNSGREVGAKSRTYSSLIGGLR